MAHAGSCSHLKIFDHKRQPTGTAMRGEKASEGGGKGSGETRGAA